MMQPERIKPLNDKPAGRGRYVLYWMQSSQRARCNHALQHAIARANDLRLPVLAALGLTEDYPQANLRHYRFMLEGLARTARELREKKVAFVVEKGSPDKIALKYASDAALIVVDRGYLHHQRKWRRSVARKSSVRLEQVEADAIVPAEAVSRKQEYAARTIRPKHHKLWKKYLVPLEEDGPRKAHDVIRPPGLDLADIDAILAGLKIDKSVAPSQRFVGGTDRAVKLLKDFIKKKLAGYAANRNDPSLECQSHMSPYLHFGQISPLAVALGVWDARAPREDVEAYLEELLIRRELAINFVTFCEDYDSYRCAPSWARATLKKHRRDKRPARYTAAQIEAAETDDEYFNAAMREMLHTGKMHNYMRMYWGKRILTWTGSPAFAYRMALRLNNKYFIDGRDPSSFANVGWLFGLHDRPWAENPIFGTVRRMTASGLERKFDMPAYLRRAEDWR